MRALVLMAILTLPLGARAAPWEWRGSVGAQLDPSSHGTVDLGLRKGPFAIQLFTDTLDIRYAPETARGRFWIAARGEAAAAGLLISPWTAGAPDPSRALIASYAGADGGWMRYLPHSIYAGAQAWARVYFFGRADTTKIEVPKTTAMMTVDAVIGRWTPTSHIWIRAGADLTPERASPHLALSAMLTTEGTWVPRLEVRAGWARNQDFLMRTRLGGLNPYVVPLAGAGWAEWWVENYAAARLSFGRAGPSITVEGFVDAAAFDDQVATGVGLLARWRWKRLAVEGIGGWAPWIPRQPGVARFAGWLLVSIDWGDFRRW